VITDALRAVCLIPSVASIGLLEKSVQTRNVRESFYRNVHSLFGNNNFPLR